LHGKPTNAPESGPPESNPYHWRNAPPATTGLLALLAGHLDYRLKTGQSPPISISSNTLERVLTEWKFPT